MKSKKMLFSSVLKEVAEQYGNKTALVWKDRQCSYEQLNVAVNNFAVRLKDAGLKKDQHVALWGYNSINWLVAFMGIIKAGGVAVLTNFSMVQKDVTDLLRMTDTQFLIYGNNKAVEKNPDVPVYIADELGIEKEHIFNICPDNENLTAIENPAPWMEDVRSEEEAHDTAFIIFTTGTTSMPKAVQQSQIGVLYGQIGIREPQKHTGMCVAVPFFHIFGLYIVAGYMPKGVTLYIPEIFKADVVAEIVSQYHVTDLATVGAVYLGLCKEKNFERDLVPYLHTCFIAGSLITPVQMMRFEMDFANATFINMYGQSECAPITKIERDDAIEKRSETVGRIYEDLDVRIYDEKKGFVTGQEIGEIVVKGIGLMNGYYKLPQEKQPFDQDGYLHTGDLGYFDEEGYLHLSGRIKDIIIRGGENISPSEVEAKLAEFDNIQDVKVMGAPHPIFGESVEACVVLKNVEDFDQEFLKKELRKKIAPFKIPTHFFIYKEFPLNANGKLDQRSLRMDMLNRVKKLSIIEKLNHGILVADLTVKNTAYNVVPVSSMVRNFAYSIGNSERTADRICLAVEEMLQERIVNAYDDVGDIRVQLVLKRDWLQIRFSDYGQEYFIDKNKDSSASAKLILHLADNFSSIYNERKQPVYCMDFVYDKELDIQEFLMKN